MTESSHQSQPQNDIDEVLSLGLFDIDFNGEPSLLNSALDISKDSGSTCDSSLCLNENDFVPTSALNNFDEGFSGSRSYCNMETEGNNDCPVRQYETVEVETCVEADLSNDSPVLLGDDIDQMAWLDEIVNVNILEELPYADDHLFDFDEAFIEDEDFNEYGEMFIDPLKSTPKSKVSDSQNLCNNSTVYKADTSKWSIFTDTLSYPTHPEDKAKSGSYYCPPKTLKSNYEDSQYNRDVERINMNKQQNLMSIPEHHSDYFFNKKNTKTRHSDHILPIFEKDNRYDNISWLSTPSYDSKIDISTTYLYSNPNATSQKGMVFDRGVIQLSSQMKVMGTLPDGNICRTLIDSGATTSMISKDFYNRNPLLHQCPKYTQHEMSVKIADDTIMTSKEAIKFCVNFQGHWFELIAYIFDMGPTLDLIFGVKSATELEASLTFADSEFTFTQRSLKVFPCKRLEVPPNKTVQYEAFIENVPENFKEGKPLLKMFT